MSPPSAACSLRAFPFHPSFLWPNGWASRCGIQRASDKSSPSVLLYLPHPCLAPLQSIYRWARNQEAWLAANPQNREGEAKLHKVTQKIQDFRAQYGRAATAEERGEITKLLVKTLSQEGMDEEDEEGDYA